MKLLLTSNGLSNDSIAQAFEDLIGKTPGEAKVAFIPTAGFIDRGDKDWLIKDMYRIFERGYQVDIIDLAVLTPDQIKEALIEVDAIFVGGGNTFYLSYMMEKTGLFDLLPDLLETKVYAGISAGSMIVGQSLILTSQAQKNMQAFLDEHYDDVGPHGQSLNKTFKLVDFIFRPHLNSQHFSLVKIDELKDKAKGLNTAVYALDDNSALKIIDENVEVISEGEWTYLDPIA